MAPGGFRASRNPLEDDYDRVNLQLRTEGKAGEFVRVIGENPARVTVYKSGIAYIEDASEDAHLGLSPNPGGA
jgi:hypothetical protein